MASCSRSDHAWLGVMCDAGSRTARCVDGLKRASKAVVVARGATYVAGARKELSHLVAMSPFSQQLAYKCILGARSVWHLAIGQRGEG
jgi:hypothetical protein